MSDHKCAQCAKTFTRRDSLQKHVLFRCVAVKPKPYDPQKPKWTCRLCGKLYASQGGLSNHFYSKHKDKEGSICDKCGKSFTRKDNLQRHQQLCNKHQEHNEDTNKDAVPQQCGNQQHDHLQDEHEDAMGDAVLDANWASNLTFIESCFQEAIDDLMSPLLQESPELQELPQVQDWAPVLHSGPEASPLLQEDNLPLLKIHKSEVYTTEKVLHYMEKKTMETLQKVKNALNAELPERDGRVPIKASVVSSHYYNYEGPSSTQAYHVVKNNLCKYFPIN